MVNSPSSIAEAWTENFSSTDYNTKSFVYNMKEFTFILLIIGLYYLFAFFMKRRDIKFFEKKKINHKKYFAESLRSYRNSLIRFGIEAYLPILAAIFIEFKSIAFTPPIKAFSFFFALLSLFGLVSLYAANIYLLAKHRKFVIVTAEQ